MKQGKFVLAVWFSLAFALLGANPAEALFSDKKSGKWNLIGKFKPQVTFRTNSAPDNNPIPIEAWDMTSQRNLLLLEFRHDLRDLTSWLDVAYYLQGRAYYDGVWDYGPAVFSDDATRAFYLFNNREQINDLKWDADLYLGYLDLTGGPAFLRLGRQIVSWGEMSTLRVLDGINPLDTSTLAVDLLERLVPLFMVRTNLAFDDVGPFSSVSVQGYFIPGKVDNRNGEDMIDGSPVYPPIGRNTIEDLSDPLSMASLQQVTRQVEDDIDSNRYGVKLGVMWGGLDFNLAYYRQYSDRPVPRIDLASVDPVHITLDYLFRLDPRNPIGWALGGQKLDVVLSYEPVDVYGGSFNYHWDLIDTVVRGEVAFLKNVPKMTPGSIQEMADGIGRNIYLDFLPGSPTLGGVGRLIPPDVFGALPFSTGRISTFDVVKYGLGFDKFMKIPPLNSEDFVLILEYVGSKNLDYQKNTILQGWYDPDGNPVYETEYTNTVVFIANTNYLNGNLTPQLVTMFEVEPSALSLIPSVKYQWRDFEFEGSYMHTFSRTYEGNLGMLETRNELTFSATYNF